MPTKRRYLSPKEQATVIERQSRRCACGCGEALVVGHIDLDHIVPLWAGGTNDLSNFAALVRKHHLQKTHGEATQRAKEKRVRDRHLGLRLNARQRALAKMLDRTKQLSE